MTDQELSYPNHSEAAKLRWKDPAYRAKQDASRKASWTPERREAASKRFKEQWAKGRPVTQETRDKMSKASKGKPKSAAHRAAMRVSHNRNPQAEMNRKIGRYKNTIKRRQAYLLVLNAELEINPKKRRITLNRIDRCNRDIIEYTQKLKDAQHVEQN